MKSKKLEINKIPIIKENQLFKTKKIKNYLIDLDKT